MQRTKCKNWEIANNNIVVRCCVPAFYSNVACSKSAVIVDCFCNSFLSYCKLQLLFGLICCVMIYRILPYRHCYINRILSFRFNCSFTVIESCDMSVISGQSRIEEVGELLPFSFPPLHLSSSFFLPLFRSFPFPFPSPILSPLFLEVGALKYS